MTVRTLLILSLSIMCQPLLADEPRMGPVFDEYGPTFAIDDLDVPLRKRFTYKAVFDAGTYRGGPTALNQELVSVARYLNMHTRHGVAAKDMKVAVILHGEALKSALNDAAYESRHATANRSSDLLLKLHQAGVSFYACGQSMGFREIRKEELLSPVKVALSAMTMLTVLQSDGYALMQ